MKTGEGKIFVIIFSLMKPGWKALSGLTSPSQARVLPAMAPQACRELLSQKSRRSSESPVRPPPAGKDRHERAADNKFWKRRISHLIGRALR